MATDDCDTAQSSDAPPTPPPAKKRPIPRGTAAVAMSAQERAPMTPGVEGLQAITPGVAAPMTPPDDVRLVPTPPSDPPPGVAPPQPPTPPPAPPDWVYTSMGGGHVDGEGGGSRDDRGGGGGGGHAEHSGGRGGGAQNSGWKIKAACLIVALADGCLVDAGNGPKTAAELAQDWQYAPQLQSDIDRVRRNKARPYR